MIYEKIDLYSYFKMERGSAKGGFLTVYAPDNSVEVNPNRVRPAMLVIPGGGYAAVSFREGEPVVFDFLKGDYACFLLDYSTLPPSGEYTPLKEGALAMLYIRENEKKYHLSGMTSAVGFSAGGHLAGSLATLYNDFPFDRWFDEETRRKIRPDGVLLGYPVVSSIEYAHEDSFINLCGGDKERIHYFSLENHVDGNSSPAFIWSTCDDELVPCGNSLMLAKAYEAKGVKFTLRIYPSGQHGLSVADSRVYPVNCNYRSCKGVENWTAEAMNWLKELGFGVKD